MKLDHCEPGHAYDPGRGHSNDAGTFQQSSALVRPRTRYWVPDASVSHRRLAQDVSDAGRVGMGGLELIGFYGYSTAPGDFAPVDWTTYGWGTMAWKQVMKTVARAHEQNGLLMDFALGPSQGAGVPARPDDEGLQWDLVYNTTSFSGNFNGKLPGWGRSSLQAAVVGLTLSTINTTGPEPGLANAAPAFYEDPRIQIQLDAESLEDVTELVSTEGFVSVPALDNTGNYTLFAFYLKPSGLRSVESPELLTGPQSAPQGFIENGSWTVDHFSTLGAQTTIDFWERHLLDDDELRQQLTKVGQYAWEDSVEIFPTLYWTKNLPKRFFEDHGYSINKWLPLLFHENALSFNNDQLGLPWYITDQYDAGNGLIADYRETLGNLYAEYLSTLSAWANTIIPGGYSAQVSYNMPMDMLKNIPKVDGPECESLGFPEIDSYRQYAGAANLAGKRFISNEMGGNFSDAYQQTLPNLLFSVNRALASGVNRFVLHGQPYSGNYPNTTWPGYSPFYYSVSEQHSRHQPGWDFYSDSMGYIARNSFILQSGTPKVDLAFYSKFTTYSDTLNFASGYKANDLASAGYTYEFLSPENFALPEAVVADGVLASHRQSFKALIVRANDSLTDFGVEKISEYSHAGLPVVFSGGIPTRFLGREPPGRLSQVLPSLASLDNVHVVPFEGLASSLASLGIQPKSQITASENTWYTHWRQDQDAEYVFLYNDAPEAGFDQGHSSGTVEFACTGKPYLYSAWTGSITPVQNYTQTADTTSIDFTLAGNQSVIVGFHGRSYTYYDPQVRGSPDLLLLGPATGKQLTLNDWTLIVEHWNPPANLSNVDTVAAKHNTTHILPSLMPWLDIPGLRNVSGRGYYTTSFNYTGPPATPQPIIIDFGAAYHTLSVHINGQPLPALDLTSARAEISEYLRPGRNEVLAVVSTTLLNVLKPIAGQLRSAGDPGTPLLVAENQPYGLLNPVVVTFVEGNDNA